jgi:ATP adenylyltransferase
MTVSSFIAEGNSELYCLANARHEEQVQRMQALMNDNVCFFCPAGLAMFPSEEAPLAEAAHWLALKNDYPYRGARFHALLVPRAHVRDLADLESDALVELKSVLREVKRLAAADAYGLGARNGPCESTGGTIAHLHLHFLVPEGDVSLRMRFSS